VLVIPARCASDQVYDGNKYLSVFIVAMVFNAFGSVPIYICGVTYIDDASPHGTASVHLGIYNALLHSYYYWHWRFWHQESEGRYGPTINVGCEKNVKSVWGTTFRRGCLTLSTSAVHVSLHIYLWNVWPTYSPNNPRSWLPQYAPLLEPAQTTPTGRGLPGVIGPITG